MAVFTVLSDYSELMIISGLSLLVAWVFREWVRNNHVSGPFLASISNIPRLMWARSGHAHQIHIDLHRRYGKLVRLGPNAISVGEPLEVPQIYGTTGPNFGKVGSKFLESGYAGI